MAKDDNDKPMRCAECEAPAAWTCDPCTEPLAVCTSHAFRKALHGHVVMSVEGFYSPSVRLFPDDHSR